MSVTVEVDSRAESLIIFVETHFKNDKDKIWAVKAVAEIADLVWGNKGLMHLRTNTKALKFGVYAGPEESDDCCVKVTDASATDLSS
jgi:hypothetical protein